MKKFDNKHEYLNEYWKDEKHYKWFDGKNPKSPVFNFFNNSLYAHLPEKKFIPVLELI